MLPTHSQDINEVFWGTEWRAKPRRGECGVQIPDQRLELAGALAANRLVSQNTHREDINIPVVRTVSYD